LAFYKVLLIAQINEKGLMEDKKKKGDPEKEYWGSKPCRLLEAKATLLTADIVWQLSSGKTNSGSHQ